MRIKLADYPYIEDYIVWVFDKYGWVRPDHSDFNEYVYLKSKHKELINRVIIYRNAGIKSSVGFYKNNHKGQQPIYSPFAEIYNVEMEDKALLRFVFKL